MFKHIFKHPIGLKHSTKSNFITFQLESASQLLQLNQISSHFRQNHRNIRSALLTIQSVWTVPHLCRPDDVYSSYQLMPTDMAYRTRRDPVEF